MPRFIAHVRTGTDIETVDCDVAMVDPSGYLLLANEQPKGQQPHACYAPCAWLSYTLQAPPEDEPTTDSATQTPGRGTDAIDLALMGAIGCTAEELSTTPIYLRLTALDFTRPTR
ncbi:hypothetical protein LN042_11390 [Kitasatospora sp. RB6PN24]|uniref:hypothetical protein n=1 Tax=Kitasatospora humi TaxID=2893891 RepID=UPI001E35381B|nr:hypothetical protein [Kitasatospora humi]MCC9307699.1 hypothetical protein [Kitasatospora humi]